MRKLLQRLFNYRMRALMHKEFRQIRRDRRLAISLILPPTLQLLLFGFALSATVSNIRLGVVDDSRTPESRELIATLTESKSFRYAGYYFSVDQMGERAQPEQSRCRRGDPVRLHARPAARPPRHRAVPA